MSEQQIITQPKSEIRRLGTESIQTINPGIIAQQLAERPDADIEKISAMMELQFKWEANEARKAWNHAMANFKADLPDVEKNKHVTYTTSKGTTEYWHARLSELSRAINERMAEHGLNFTWDTSQDNGMLTVSCLVRHKAGHVETVTLTAGYDNSGGKNTIQAIGSAQSYLQRYTLMSATGLVPSDMEMDDDGRMTSAAAATLSGEQVAEFREILQKLGKSEEAFISRVINTRQGMENITTLEEIPASSYEKLSAFFGRLQS